MVVALRIVIRILLDGVGGGGGRGAGGVEGSGSG